MSERPEYETAAFRRYADDLPLFVWMQRPDDGRIVWANRRWYEFALMPPVDQMTEEWWAGVIHPDDLEKVLSGFRRARETRSPYELEHRVRPSGSGDSDYRWVLSRSTPRFDASGYIEYWLGTAIDIHASKTLADQTAETFRVMGDVVPQMMWSATRDGWIEWYNRRWFEYTGQTHAEAEGWGWQAVHHPDDLVQVMQAWPRSIASGLPFEMEFRLRGTDGAFRWFLTRAVPFRADDGTIVRWYGTNTDIDVTRRQRARDAFFARVGEALARTLSLEDTLRAVTRLIVPEFADWVLVNLPDADGTIRLAETYHRDPEKLAKAARLLGLEFGRAADDFGSAAVVRTMQPRIYPAVTKTDVEMTLKPEFADTMVDIGMGSAVIVPMIHAAKVVGTLSVLWAPGGAAYGPHDVPFFEQLAARIAPAIGNAASYERERRIAQTFQRAAMGGTLPSVPGLVFDAIYEAGKAEAQVGGDWYDAFRLGDGRIVVSVGDVSGSGLDAAVMMSNVRQSIRTAALINPEPAAIVDAVDRIVRAMSGDRFATAFVGVLDPVHLELAYVSAGHPPALLRDAAGTVTLLDYGSLPLGLRERSMQRSSIASLGEGSMLVLYTDGLTEHSRDVVAGEAAVVAALESTLEPSSAARSIYQAILSAHEAGDDVAILTVSVERGVHRSGVTRWSFDARDAGRARSVRLEYAERLRAAGLDSPEVADAELVFSELLGNVFRYAVGKVDISLDESAAFPVLHVRDGGGGFEYNSRLPADPMQETGRGLFIVSSVADELTVSQRAGGGSHARAVIAGRIHRAAERERRGTPAATAGFDAAE